MKHSLAFVLLILINILVVEAQELTADSVAYYAQTKKIVASLNDSTAVEYAPSISADGKTLIFETNINGPYKLYESKKDDTGTWGSPLPIDKINNYGDSTDFIGGPSLSFDGNTLYFFGSFDREGSENIYYSRRNIDGWSEPIDIGLPINSPEYEGFPSISADGKTLYFVRRNPDGPSDKELQKLDMFCESIYRSYKDSNGLWTTPIKLPAPINKDCERSPKIMADGKTLIFSSNRPGGQGDFDMYQAKLNVLGEWGLPVPLDYVNTPKSDQLPSISASGDLMYFIYDNKDIYTVEIPPSLQQFKNNVITGKVTDRDTKQGISANIIVSNVFTSETIMELQNDPRTGNYSVVLPVGGSYNVQINKEGYSSFTQGFDLRNVNEYKESIKDIALFKTINLDLYISDSELFEPISTKIQVLKDGVEASELTVDTNPLSGLGRLELPIGFIYTIKISSANYMSHSYTFDASGLVIYRDFEKDIELVPEKIEVEIKVSDLVNNSKVKSKIRLVNKDRNEIIEVNGNEMVSLRAGDRYEIEATSDQGYAFNSSVIDLNSGVISEVNLKLLKLEQNALLTLKNILFESNSSQLSEISFTELARVIKLMKENPTLKVEIAAHTDDVGSANYNRVLSDKRAESVVQFLVENSISPDRFVAKGYGEETPKVPNDTDENRAENRRVELKILGV